MTTIKFTVTLDVDFHQYRINPNKKKDINFLKKNILSPKELILYSGEYGDEFGRIKKIDNIEIT